MAYGHAERNLLFIRQLEAETRRLLESLDQPSAERSVWLQESAAGEGGPPWARSSRDTASLRYQGN